MLLNMTKGKFVDILIHTTPIGLKLQEAILVNSGLFFLSKLEFGLDVARLKYIRQFHPEKAEQAISFFFEEWNHFKMLDTLEINQRKQIQREILDAFEYNMPIHALAIKISRLS